MPGYLTRRARKAFHLASPFGQEEVRSSHLELDQRAANETSLYCDKPCKTEPFLYFKFYSNLYRYTVQRFHTIDGKTLLIIEIFALTIWKQCDNMFQFVKRSKRLRRKYLLELESRRHDSIRLSAEIHNFYNEKFQ